MKSTASPDWALIRRADSNGELSLDQPQQFTVLFVLDGHLKLEFRMNSLVEIDSDHLIIIDNRQLSKVSCSSETTVLMFTPPEKIFLFFHCYSRALSAAYFNILPLLPELHQWINELLAEQFKANKESDDACRRKYCARLAAILNKLPPEEAGETLIPFYACSILDKKKCYNQNCTIEP